MGASDPPPVPGASGPRAGSAGRGTGRDTDPGLATEPAGGGSARPPTRGLPEQLTADELGELFEGRTRFVVRLAGVPDPLTRARTLVHELPEDEKREILDAHPAIGQQTGLSARSAAEQGADTDPDVLGELARLNAKYEARHGFRFVVFVNRRPKAEVLEVLRVRIDRTTEEELETALDELVSIAADRWRLGQGGEGGMGRR